MKTKIYLLLCIVVMHLSAISQVKIGDNSTTINSASLLELETTDKGFVLPRVSITNVNSSSPLASGLLTGTVVYNTNSSTSGGSGVGVYFWSGTKWLSISTSTSLSSSAWLLTGNSGTSASTNFIGTTDAVDFIARTNNAERLRITSGGNVGIGIANPSYKLAVLSASNPLYLSGVQATSTFSTDSILMIKAGIVKKAPYSSLTGNFWALTGNSGTNASSNFIGTSDAVDFVARTNNVERLRITSGGNVGIGIANPSYKLAVLSASNPLYLSGVQATSTFSADSVLMINAGIVKKAPYSSLTGNFWALTGNSGTSASTNFIGTTDAVDFVARTNNIERLRITSGGNVGIGIANPSYKLAVLAASDPLYLSGVQETSTFSTDSILTINAGIVKKAPYSSLTGNFWSLTGNSGTDYATSFLGTTDNVSLRFRTNNIEQMILDSIGTLSVGSYGASTFNTENPPKLSVDYGTTTSNTIAYFRGSIDNYFQINLRNKSNGLNASTDYVATADNGTDSTYYVDFGINSSGYGSGADYFGGPNDAYLYAYSRNLLIGTQKASTDIIFLLGGGSVKNNTAMRIIGPGGNIVIGKGESTTTPVGNIIRGPNAGTGTGSTNTAGGSLTLQGGSSTNSATGGNLNIAGGATSGTGTGGNVNISGGTSASGTAGAVLFNTAASERMRIDASGNVGIGNANPSNKLSVIASSNPLYLSGVQTGSGSIDSVLTILNGVVRKIPSQGNFTNISKNQYSVTTTTSIGNNSGVTLNITVPNVSYNSSGANSTVLVNPSADLADGLVIAWARVSATNTVSIALRNTTNSSIPPQTFKFDVSVIQ